MGITLKEKQRIKFLAWLHLEPFEKFICKLFISLLLRVRPSLVFTSLLKENLDPMLCNLVFCPCGCL
jgi:hypothetical protein